MAKRTIREVYSAGRSFKLPPMPTPKADEFDGHEPETVRINLKPF